MKVTDEMVDRLWDEIFDSDTLAPPAPSTLRRGLEAALADVPEPPPVRSNPMQYYAERAKAAEAKLAKVCEWAWQTGSGTMNWTKLYQILDGD